MNKSLIDTLNNWLAQEIKSETDGIWAGNTNCGRRNALQEVADKIKSHSIAAPVEPDKDMVGLAIDAFCKSAGFTIAPDTAQIFMSPHNLKLAIRDTVHALQASGKADNWMPLPQKPLTKGE